MRNPMDRYEYYRHLKKLAADLDSPHSAFQIEALGKITKYAPNLLKATIIYIEENMELHEELGMCRHVIDSLNNASKELKREIAELKELAKVVPLKEQPHD
jgi:hypothetical protein